jgi:hypothetical protein
VCGSFGTLPPTAHQASTTWPGAAVLKLWTQRFRKALRTSFFLGTSRSTNDIQWHPMMDSAVQQWIFDIWISGEYADIPGMSAVWKFLSGWFHVRALAGMVGW